MSAERANRKLGPALQDCSECGFLGTDRKDAVPGGFISKNGSPVEGDWRKALIERHNFSVATNAIERRNMNDFLHHVPVGILQKGTRLLHVSLDSDWVRTSMVGDYRGGATLNSDAYSFFTLENRGFAINHSNDFNSRISLQLLTDVHCFFLQDYSFRYWYPRDVPYPGGRSQWEIRANTTHFGGELVGAIKGSWPSKYRPAAWASCSECELAFHNSIIPTVMRTVSIATSNDGFGTTKKALPLEEIPIASSNAVPGKSTWEWWLSPRFYNRTKVIEAERQFNRGNRRIDPAFFE